MRDNGVVNCYRWTDARPKWKHNEARLWVVDFYFPVSQPLQLIIHMRLYEYYVFINVLITVKDK